MLDWLVSLSVLEQILLYIAVPATLLLLLQTVLLLTGIGGDDGADVPDLDGADELTLDLDGDGFPDLDVSDLYLPDAQVHSDPGGELNDGHVQAEHSIAGGLHLLTMRGLVAFFTLFGWSGLLFCQIGLHWLLALFFAIQIGIIGMVVVAVLLREALRLQSDGTLDIRNALGREGTVYLKVPANRTGQEKVTVLVQEQLREFEAVTDGENPIPTGAEIIVIGITGGDTLVVSKKVEL